MAAAVEITRVMSHKCLLVCACQDSILFVPVREVVTRDTSTTLPAQLPALEAIVPAA